MPSAHAQFSPSAAHRWLRCPGSIQAAEGLTERRTSAYAAEGTAAHEVREQCLAMGFEPIDFLGETLVEDGFEIEVTEEMVNALTPGIERLLRLPGTMWVEERVGFDRWLPDQFGTLDTGMVHKYSIEVNDLKYGAGVPVSPEENEQLMTYALGFWDQIARHHTKATDFRIVIDQPRAAGGGGVWETTLERLLDFGMELEEAYRIALEPDAPLVAGDKQCKFCPLKSDCPALAALAMETMVLKFEDLDEDEDFQLVPRDKLTPAQRSKVAANSSLITSWMSAVSGRVLEDAMSGQPTPGLKAVVGRRGPRQWADPEKARAFLLKRLDAAEAVTEPKLISPNQAQKKIPKDHLDDLNELTFQSEGKPVLVSEDDRRAAVSTADKFDDLEEDEFD